MKVPKELNSVVPPTGVFINTNYFNESARHYKTHGCYTYAPDGSKDFYDFWDREKKRCLNGYSVGGVRITGSHYFYLNYFVILLVENNVKGVDGVLLSNSADRVLSTPRFWDSDYYYFHVLEIARQKGKHVILLKARGKGYSYKSASLLVADFHLRKNTKSYAFAFETEYLTKDGLMTKFDDASAFLDANTPWYQPKLIDRTMHKKSGYKVKIHGGYVEKGTKNEVMAVTMKDNPDKARGKRGRTILWEEAGKFPNLLKSWEISRLSVEQGRFATGQMIAFGTGGTEDADYEGLVTMFYNPDDYNVMAFENIWDEGESFGRKSGYFIPAFDSFEGFIDDDGNSYAREAKEFIEAEREAKRQSRASAKSLGQFICELPFNPAEATLSESSNLFPVQLIQEQLNSVLVRKRFGALTNGYLYYDRDGIKFRPSREYPPIYDFPVSNEVDTTGCISILEAPYKDQLGNIPKGLYIIGHDPYAHDKSIGPSLGAAYVIKMSNSFSMTLNDCIVASYVGRPETQDQYNSNLFMLAEYYNAEIGFENDRGDVIGYAKRFKKLDYLAEEFLMLDKKELQSHTTRRNWGMHMTENRKLQGEIYIRDWLNTKISEGVLVLNTIVDPGLLKELVKFRRDGGNYDRVMAIMVAMYHSKELFSKVIYSEQEDRFNSFFRRRLFL